MFSTCVTVEGNLVADPELRFTKAGKAACEGRVLASERRQNEAGEWGEPSPPGAGSSSSARRGRTSPGRWARGTGCCWSGR